MKGVLPRSMLSSSSVTCPFMPHGALQNGRGVVGKSLVAMACRFPACAVSSSLHGSIVGSSLR